MLCLRHTTCILCVVPSEAEGEKLEKELNGTGPGEAYFIKCDVTKEEDIKVSLLSGVPPIWSYFFKKKNPNFLVSIDLWKRFFPISTWTS